MKTLDKSDIYKIGSFDNGGRFELSEEFETDTSRSIRSPSRAWPLSVWKHCKTAKYFNSLSGQQLAKLNIFLGV